MQNAKEKEVVEKAYKVEKSLYQQTKLSDLLEKQIDEIKEEPDLNAIKERDNFFEYFRESYNEQIGFAIILGLSLAIVIVSFVLYLDKVGALNTWFGIFDLELKTIKVYFIKALIWGMLTFLVVYLIGYLFYVREIKSYNLSAIKKNQQIEIEYKERLTKLKPLESEYNWLVTESIPNTQKIRNAIYKLEYIAGDYRNLVAVSSFYQYFRTGRVDSLRGPYGAYNKYEEESRSDLIIQKLDDIIDCLDIIQKNQRLLYEAIEEAKRTNQKIVNELTHISIQNEQIVTNSYITAYNSRIIAQNTEVLKWYEMSR